MAQAMLNTPFYEQTHNDDEEHFIQQYKRVHLDMMKYEIEGIIKRYTNYELKKKNTHNNLRKTVLIKTYIKQVILTNADIEATNIARDQYHEVYTNYECSFKHCRHTFRTEDELMLHEIQHEVNIS